MKPKTQAGRTTSSELFGALLRHFRIRAGLTQDQLAGVLPVDRSLVGHFEAGTRTPDRKHVEVFDALLGADGLLLEMWEKIDWAAAQPKHPDWFKRRAEMDAELTVLREYQSQVMPGLLQTEPYARALFQQKSLSGDEVEQLVRARLSRQERFLDPDGPLLICVIDESALRTVVGGPRVMRDQCAHLLAVGRQPNIRVQVAPAEGAHLMRPNTPMSLITLPSGRDWLYSESLDRGHFSSHPAVIAKHARDYDVLRADALSADESAALIRDVMEGYGQHEHPRTQRGDVAQEQLQRQQRRQLRRGGPRIRRRRSRA
ncbi:helix-turn-helix domain-containing protein [Streptomyces sp. AC536]|uniref:helix-turn-helix domain-containing protein n=1 Tax=Streptomyces buecherae TaxID=2763006 RepID=UPI00164E24DD|nr:helix-turn-helix transcriptional regulator [Streptomyces buecherae]MBC3983573.1 helix-turn-helix domain-containing protein [Streptomyces buecherae]QNJ42307.1 helix-turn-helix domain-containing protein [Streptomyces buecherae]